MKFDIDNIVRVVKNTGSSEKDKFIGNMYKIADYSPDRKYCYKLDGLIEDFCFAEEELEEVNIKPGDRFKLKQVYGDSPEDEELINYIGEEVFVKDVKLNETYPLIIEFDDGFLTGFKLNEIELIDEEKYKVGDTVELVDIIPDNSLDDANSLLSIIGKKGKIKSVDESEIPYLVSFDNNCYWVKENEIKLVNDNVNNDVNNVEIKTNDEVVITKGALKDETGIVRYKDRNNCVVETDLGLSIHKEKDLNNNELYFADDFKITVKDGSPKKQTVNKMINDLKTEDQGAKIVDDVLVVKLGDKHFVTDTFWESK